VIDGISKLRGQLELENAAPEPGPPRRHFLFGRVLVDDDSDQADEDSEDAEDQDAEDGGRGLYELEALVARSLGRRPLAALNAGHTAPPVPRGQLTDYCRWCQQAGQRDSAGRYPHAAVRVDGPGIPDTPVPVCPGHLTWAQHEYGPALRIVDQVPA
jgi:hypothetical protein